MLGREVQSWLLGRLAVFLVAMAACAVLGFLIERLAYRPLREKPRLTALITAIGISFAISCGRHRWHRQPHGAVTGALLLGLCEELVVWFGSCSWRDAMAEKV